MSQPNLVGPSHLGPPPASGDVNIGPLSFRVGLAFEVIATIVITLRFIAHGYGRWNYGWDDWTMLFAFVRTYASLALGLC